MTHIDTSAEACERVVKQLVFAHEQFLQAPIFLDAAALIRQLVRERDEARERALDEAAGYMIDRANGCPIHSQSEVYRIHAKAILALKGPKP